MNGDSPLQPDPNQAQSPWQYKQGDAVAQPVVGTPQQYTPIAPAQPLASSADYLEEVSWTASEFVAHEKSSSWYLVFGSGVVVASVILYFMTRDIFPIAILILFACMMAFAASRKPRVVSYNLNQRGLTIGSKFYKYDDFRSFGIIQEGAFSCIVLDSVKRLGMPISAYYDPADEAKILDVISLHLPFEKKERDAVERLSQRIRF